MCKPSLQDQLTNGCCGKTVFQVGATQIAGCWSVGIGTGWPHQSQGGSRQSGIRWRQQGIWFNHRRRHLASPSKPPKYLHIRSEADQTTGRGGRLRSVDFPDADKMQKSGSAYQTSPSDAVHALITRLCCTSKYSMCILVNLQLFAFIFDQQYIKLPTQIVQNTTQHLFWNGRHQKWKQFHSWSGVLWVGANFPFLCVSKQRCKQIIWGQQCKFVQLHVLNSCN